MSAVYSFTQGDTPLLVSMPHSGERLPPLLLPRLTESGRALVDTDWHLKRLYSFLADLEVSLICADYSRYVIDLNRPVGGDPLYPGQRETELCPTSSFMDQPLYQEGREPEQNEIRQRIEQYWQPYHQRLEQELARIKERFGYALLWDAHSIQSRLPRFFAGRLPDLNLGTAAGASCSEGISRRLLAVLEQNTDYTFAYNGRFKGGYITRHYGNPAENIHAVQMEIAQTNYMSEYPGFTYDAERAGQLQQVLAAMVRNLLRWRPNE